MNPRTVALAFRVVAVAEALSWVGLLAGTYVKYVPATTEAGVQFFGPVHGAVFVAYVVVALVAARVLGWSRWTALLALAASVPPLATVVFERWAARTGRLQEPARV
jgi:integral membrane protein